MARSALEAGERGDEQAADAPRARRADGTDLALAGVGAPTLLGHLRAELVQPVLLLAAHGPLALELALEVVEPLAQGRGALPDLGQVLLQPRDLGLEADGVVTRG